MKALFSGINLESRGGVVGARMGGMGEMGALGVVGALLGLTSSTSHSQALRTMNKLQIFEGEKSPV